MKTADRSAGNRDKGEGKDFSGEDRAGTVDEARERRHMQRGMNGHDSNTKQADGAQFHKGAQVVARR